MEIQMVGKLEKEIELNMCINFQQMIIFLWLYQRLEDGELSKILFGQVLWHNTHILYLFLFLHRGFSHEAYCLFSIVLSDKKTP